MTDPNDYVWLVVGGAKPGVYRSSYVLPVTDRCHIIIANSQLTVPPSNAGGLRSRCRWPFSVSPKRRRNHFTVSCMTRCPHSQTNQVRQKLWTHSRVHKRCNRSSQTTRRTSIRLLSALPLVFIERGALPAGPRPTSSAPNADKLMLLRRRASAIRSEASFANPFWKHTRSFWEALAFVVVKGLECRMPPLTTSVELMTSEGNFETDVRSPIMTLSFRQPQTLRRSNQLNHWKQPCAIDSVSHRHHRRTGSPPQGHQPFPHWVCISESFAHRKRAHDDCNIVFVMHRF